MLEQKKASWNLTLALSWTSDVEERNGHIGIVTGVARIIKVDFEVIDIFILEFKESLILGWLDEVGPRPPLAKNEYIAAVYVGKIVDGLRSNF